MPFIIPVGVNFYEAGKAGMPVAHQRYFVATVLVQISFVLQKHQSRTFAIHAKNR